MAIGLPDIIQHNNSELASVDGNFVRGGLKQLADFTTGELSTLNVDQLKEGNLLFITAGTNVGKLYKLMDITNHSLTANWQEVGISDIINDLSPQLGGDLDANGNNIINIPELDFDTTRTGDVTVGEIAWDNDLENFVFGVDSTSIVLGSPFWFVKNQTGATITKGTPVYASGTTGASGRINITKMIADGTVAIKLYLGVVATDITDGSDGLVITQGKIRGIDTSSFTAGNVLYVSAASAGVFTATKPSIPNLAIPSAFVIYSDASVGSIAVRVSNLDENEYMPYDAITQTFTNIADTNFTINFNSEDFTINRHLTSITANKTVTISNAVSGSQFVIDVSIGSGEVDHELIFSGPSSPTIIPDYINGTSDGVKFPGNASAATKYTVIGWYNGTEWRINVIDWN